MRISNLSTKSGSMSSSDYFPTDNGTIVTKINFNALAQAIIESYSSSSLAGSAQSVKAALDNLANVIADGAGAHNAIYRGKSLGSSVTTAQWNAISAGTFKDLFIGDYWTINSVNWRIAHFDYWYKYGDTQCTTHHVVIVPDSNLTSGVMNSSNITTGAYVGSGFYSGTNADTTSNTAKATCLTAIQNAFGSAHILTHREYLTNAQTAGYPTGGAWFDSDIELMSERMVYGSSVYAPGNSLGSTIPNMYTTDHSQLALFKHDHSKICNRAAWWLRDPVSAAHFAYVNAYGSATCYTASASLGIRPAFAICVA